MGLSMSPPARMGQLDPDWLFRHDGTVAYNVVTYVDTFSEGDVLVAAAGVRELKEHTSEIVRRVREVRHEQ